MSRIYPLSLVNRLRPVTPTIIVTGVNKFILCPIYFCALERKVKAPPADINPLSPCLSLSLFIIKSVLY